MMRRNKLSILWHSVLAILILAGCSKDMGNYTYQPINEAKVTNINASYSVFRGQKLEIKPTLSFTQDNSNDSTKYTYLWSLIDGGNRKNIATTQALNWIVNYPSGPSPYTVYYVVTDKSTGQVYRTSFSLEITTNIADGWLVLNEVNNSARLDFYNYIAATDQFQYYQDVLATQANLTLKGKPISLSYYLRRDPFTLVIARTIMVSTDQNTTVINTHDNTFNNYSDMSKIMSAYYPPPYYAQKFFPQGRTNVAYMFDNLGQLHFENVSLGFSFGVGVNRTADGQVFKISPFIAEAYANTLNYALMYDIDKKRFMEHKGSNNVSAVPSTASTLFNPGNMGMTLLFMQATQALSGQTFALFKDANNKLFLARIISNYNVFTPVAFNEVTTAPEMLNATQFAIDPREGYIMYLVGNKVYRYNPFDKTNTVVVDMGSRKVSLIKYQKLTYLYTLERYVDYSNKLIVCSYDEASPNNSGKMELYNVPNLNGALTLYKSFDGLGKIIDVSYRE